MSKVKIELDRTFKELSSPSPGCRIIFTMKKRGKKKRKISKKVGNHSRGASNKSKKSKIRKMLAALKHRKRKKDNSSSISRGGVLLKVNNLMHFIVWFLT